MSEYFYARVSSRDQSLARQLESARDYKNITRVFTDKQSGKNFVRDGYQEMKRTLVPGDEVIVHALDRLGRNKEAIKEELAWFRGHGVVVRILNVPTTLIEYPAGQEWVLDMVNNILIEVLGAFAEQERESIRKRQAEGIAAMPLNEAGRRVSTKPGKEGHVYGPVEKEVPPEFSTCLEQVRNKKLTATAACVKLGISRSLWYKWVREVA